MQAGLRSVFRPKIASAPLRRVSHTPQLIRPSTVRFRALHSTPQSRAMLQLRFDSSHSEKVHCWTWTCELRRLDWYWYCVYHRPCTVCPRRRGVRWTTSCWDVFQPRRLGDFHVFLDIGIEYNIVDQIGAVESVKAASDIVSICKITNCHLFQIWYCQYAPVSGVVEEINESLSSEPGLLNKSAEDKGKHNLWDAWSFIQLVAGWLCKIKLTDPSEVSHSFGSLFRRIIGIDMGAADGGINDRGTV